MRKALTARLGAAYVSEQLPLLALPGAILVLALSGCAASSSGDVSGKPQVLATFTVIADMVESIAGDRVEVASITKAGAEIHGYEPTPSDIVKAERADLIFDNGLGLERWFEQHHIRPQIVGEFEDSALMSVFAARGLGVFPVSRLGADDLSLMAGLHLLGQTEVVEDVHAIYSRRGQNHPLVAKLLERRGTPINLNELETEIASAK